MKNPSETLNFREALSAADSAPLLLDGGLGTHLAQRGNDVSGELWSAQILKDRPEEVRAAHADFFAAGAQLATTCSYQVSIDGLANTSKGASTEQTAAQAEELLRTSVRLAREAANGSPARWVAASVGPYGAGPGSGTEYDGAYGRTVAELADWHRGRLRVLADAGADVLICETVPSLAEVQALAGEAAGLDLPVLLSLAVRTAADGQLVLGDGSDLREAARIANDSGAFAALGVNCCPVPVAVAALKVLRELTDLPLLAYPNSGEIWDREARSWLPGTPGTDLPGAVPELIASGARIIGGCCQVGPEQITRVGNELGRLKG
ncbi:homocysteine S-methyltransferase [Arthrobacter sp. MYb224]|uniref:homocysteine S-methyltransferase n=1 Tax=Arthrobacter sp. MYb224 TaxID=1848600 RepID=UPI002158146A|nr:homocysteine S-methyltransferase [Arthrobacter sp. MYb224]